MKITEEGLLIPREVAGRLGSEEVEVREEPGRLSITPATAPAVASATGAEEPPAREIDEEDPILGLGRNPVRDGVTDASVDHDRYLYGRNADGDGEAGAGASGADGERGLDWFVSVLRQCLPEIRERFGVESLGVFGSYARGEQGAGSDLDVLVGFRNTPDLFVFMDLEEYLGELLGVEVELVSRGSLGGKVERRVMGEVVPV